MDKPILFSGEMVKAILDGRKTQTRRVAKTLMNDDFNFQHEPDFKVLGVKPEALKKCPYGKPGDLLWVRESWQAWTEFDDIPPRDIPSTSQVNYLADDNLWDSRRRPSMFMPRWASRITLEITGVRVERLNEMAEVDAKAEGINCYQFRPDDGYPICNGYTHLEDDGKCPLNPTAVDAFRDLWRSINGPDSWDANPFVWVVEFRPILTNVDWVPEAA